MDTVYSSKTSYRIVLANFTCQRCLNTCKVVSKAKAGILTNANIISDKTLKRAGLHNSF